MYIDMSDRCQICGESPVGCHYGTWCCNSCKCFFRRCVIKQGKYQCRKGDKQCEITKETRNSCRACRYAKCTAVGLTPKMVHRETTIVIATLPIESQPGSSLPEVQLSPVPVRSQSISSTTILAPSSTTSTALAGGDNEDTNPYTTTYQHQSLLSTPNRMAMEMSTALPLGSISGLLYQSNDPLSRYFVLAERLCESYRETALSTASSQIVFSLNTPLQRAFLEPRSLIARTAVDWDARYSLTDTVYMLPRQWCRVVAFHTDWASHIPELQQLDLDDRVRMLAGRVKQCTCLWAASRSITRSAGQLAVFSDGGCYPLDPVEQARVDPEVNKLFQPLCNLLNVEIIRPGLDIQVREEELALLKVLCFCVPVAGLKPTSLAIMQSAQAKYQAALVEEAMKNPVSEGMLGNIGRLMKMMSWLTTAERAAEEGNKHLSLMTLFNIAEMKGSLPYELHVRSG